MNFTEKLEEWFKAEKEAGRVLDVKFFPGVDPDGSVNKLACAAYETLTGKRASKAVDTSNL